MNLWHVLMLAGFFGGYGLDYYESWILRRKAGREEGHQWYRNPDGSLKRRTVLLITLPIYIGVFIGMYFFGNAVKADHQTYNVGLYSACVTLLGAGIAHGIMGWHNVLKDRKAIRKAQGIHDA